MPSPGGSAAPISGTATTSCPTKLYHIPSLFFLRASSLTTPILNYTWFGCNTREPLYRSGKAAYSNRAGINANTNDFKERGSIQIDIFNRTNIVYLADRQTKDQAGPSVRGPQRMYLVMICTNAFFSTKNTGELAAEQTDQRGAGGKWWEKVD
ncbi:hypothetical protein DSO57_1028447 [Entomophthora muscae]|uniref:Uncharacterized protein n=1 Tax=Entomophthora muscae TaxID=34485 RepID=A0ACC2SEE5_9FUNG|nr:hypothetical protein DSO57_1028447 [Entomophthora muscae]